MTAGSPAAEHGIAMSVRLSLSLLLALVLPGGIARAAAVHWSLVTPPEGAEGVPVVMPEGLLFGGSVLALLDASGTSTVYADSSTQLPGSSATFKAFGPEE